MACMSLLWSLMNADRRLTEPSAKYENLHKKRQGTTKSREQIYSMDSGKRDRQRNLGTHTRFGFHVSIRLK